MRTYRAYSLNAIWVLIAINVLVFIITSLRPDIIFLLGLTPAYFPDLPWTIISNVFVHGSLWHILFNMLSLYFLGSFLIRLLGEKKFLAVYFLGGIVGNIFYILLAPALSIGIGASGAIFALGGALAMMAPKLPVFMFFIPVPVPLWIAMLIFLVISFLGRGIAWQAHLGGLLLGLGAGYYYRKKIRVYF
ncbi:MAG: rhomboid family intramembrane serine protease [Dehalococcoidia bacterium]|nr:rhomboid family intramembrane serine protease [Dehalococcoidia bacterium]